MHLTTSRDRWHEAYSMARRMVRNRERYDLFEAAAWVRISALGYGYPRRMVEAAARLAVERKSALSCRLDDRATLAREGLLTRAYRFDPSFLGNRLMAVFFDDLAALHLRRTIRVHRRDHPALYARAA